MIQIGVAHGIMNFRRVRALRVHRLGLVQIPLGAGSPNQPCVYFRFVRELIEQPVKMVRRRIVIAVIVVQFAQLQLSFRKIGEFLPGLFVEPLGFFELRGFFQQISFDHVPFVAILILLEKGIGKLHRFFIPVQRQKESITISAASVSDGTSSRYFLNCASASS